MQHIKLQCRGAGSPQRRRAAVIPCFLLLLLLLVLTAATETVAAASEGHPVRPLHGPGYEHLDCSACLGVSRALYDKLNATLSANPSTYLASHRLNRANKLRRLPYRNSELLVTEVMDNLCTSYQNDERTLRMHPKSKVRLYHQQVWKDAGLGVRHALREDEVYPPGATELWWGDPVELRRYAIATVYSPTDQEALHGLERLSAIPTMCATLVEAFEEEMDELVKVARTLSEVEYGLCGLPLPNATADAEEVRATIRPIANTCARTSLLRTAAQQDQLRWSQYKRRETRRKEKLAEKLKVAADAAEAEAAAGDAAAAGEEPAEGSAAVDANAAASAEASRDDVMPVEAVEETEEATAPLVDSDEGDL